VADREKEKEKEWEASREEIKRDYEFKLATLQNKSNGSEERVKVLEEELELLQEASLLIILIEEANDDFLQRTEDMGGTIRNLQRELEEAKAARINDQKYHENDLMSWKMRYDQLEEESARNRGGVSAQSFS
jgi:hypothetical protein